MDANTTGESSKETTTSLLAYACPKCRNGISPWRNMDKSRVRSSLHRGWQTAAKGCRLCVNTVSICLYASVDPRCADKPGLVFQKHLCINPEKEEKQSRLEETWQLNTSTSQDFLLLIKDIIGTTGEIWVRSIHEMYQYYFLDSDNVLVF